MTEDPYAHPLEGSKIFYDSELYTLCIVNQRETEFFIANSLTDGKWVRADDPLIEGFSD